MNTKQRIVAPLAEACMAKRSQRFWEYVVDGIILYVLTYGISYIIGYRQGYAAAAQAVASGVDSRQAALQAMAAIMAKAMAVSVLIENIIAVLYYFISEAFFHGKTIGKSATGLRTVTLDGSQPSAGAILLRSLCRLIPFYEFSVLFGNYWRGGKVRGNWHDRISGTYVIKDSLVRKYNELVMSTEFESRYTRRVADRQTYDRTDAPEVAETPETKAPEAPQVTLAEGDRVVFRYGSQQEMRVGDIKADGMVSCYTFNENGMRVEAGEFPARYLDRIGD